MKRFFTLIFILTFPFLGSINSSAQNFEGFVSFDITYEIVPDEIKEYVDFLPKTQNIYIKGTKTCTEQSLMGGVNNNIYDNETGKGYLLQGFTGEKIAYEMSKSDYESQGYQSELTISYLDESKVIGGFQCKKAELKYVGVDAVFIIWYTEEIQGGFTSFYKELKGFPMEYRVNSNGITMLFEATKIVKEPVSDDHFTVPEGYTIKPYSELLKLKPKD